MPEIFDHTGAPVEHGRARVNGIRMHYVAAGAGEPLLLIHGTPKTHYYWYRLIPRLTDGFRVIAPDLRGFGETDRPLASEGYDAATNAKDMAELMTLLGHDRFHVHGEDRGAEFAYALAASERDRVVTLSFAEMLLSGLGLEEWSRFEPNTVHARFEEKGVWQWHIPFFWLPDVPDMLISGREREFWTWFIRQETWNPTAIEEHAIDEWVRQLQAPGGLRGVLETYRATFKNAELNREYAKQKLSIPVSAIGAPEFFGPLIGNQMRAVATNVEHDLVYQACGHSLALEADQRLAAHLRAFMLDRPEL